MKTLRDLITYADKQSRTLRGSMRHWLSVRKGGLDVLEQAFDIPEEYILAWVNDDVRPRLLYPYDVETLEAIGDQYKKSQKKRRRALVALIKTEGADNYVNRRLKDPRALAQLASAFAGA